MRGGSKPKFYRFRGQRLPVKEIAVILGVHENTVYNRRIGDRIAEGDELIDPYHEPPSHAVMIQIGGERLCLAHWARRKGISKETIKSRINRGVPPVLAVLLPVVPWSTRKRNARIVRTIAASFSHQRNTQIIARMLHGFNTSTNTGGYRQTFQTSPGTGVGRHARHLQAGQKPKVCEFGMEASQ